MKVQKRFQRLHASRGRRRGGPNRPLRRRGLAARAIRWAAALVLGYYLAAGLTLFSLRWINPPFTGVQLQRRIEALASGADYRPKREFTPLERIPSVLRHAVIAAEDGAFYQHSGVDWAELRKAMGEAAAGGRLRGASTISQQLVKNLFFTTHRSPLRKLVEYTLTPPAEFLLTKDRILELYLNEIEWGPGVWGAAAAARHHYGVGLDGLSRDRAVRLAACIPAPLTRRPQRMDGYAAIILERMAARGW